MNLVWCAVAAALVATGLAGALVPAIPGIPLVFGGLWLFAGVDHYRHVGRYWLIVIAAVGAAGLAVDMAAGAFGAKRVGASPTAVGGALLGSVIGVFFGLPGVLLGPFLGAMFGEWASGNSVVRSAHIGAATWLGLLVGTLVKLVCAITMVTLFGAGWWWNRGP